MCDWRRGGCSRLQCVLLAKVRFQLTVHSDQPADSNEDSMTWGASGRITADLLAGDARRRNRRISLVGAGHVLRKGLVAD